MKQYCNKHYAMYDTAVGCLDCPSIVHPTASTIKTFTFRNLDSDIFEDLVTEVKTAARRNTVSVLMGWALWAHWINNTSSMPSDFVISDNHQLQLGYLGITTNARLLSDGYNPLCESFLEPKHIYVTINHISRADIATAANGLALIKWIEQDKYAVRGERI